MIDAHQHFWKFDPVRDSWIDDSMQVLKRDFMPEDLHPLMVENGVEGCVAVQADQSLTETKFLLDLAEKHAFVSGVVGWVDLMSRDLAGTLDIFTTSSYLKGFRHILQAENEGFMLQPSFIQGLKTLSTSGYTYDLLIYENQLDEALRLVRQLPDLPVVVDHLAKPAIAHHQGEDLHHWKAKMKAMATHENVMVKLSGMVTEANWTNWTYEQLKPYMEVVLDCFSPERVMFGSDWPVCTLAASYHQVVEHIKRFCQELSDTESAQILGLNAKKFYNL
ncbi:amidohydrolase family protein [Marinoscillum furvescens]|uniref:L-fuconolactonase n=1 Tax=Marinoscillum furvescens DSM 4134 TaxID=1122208 RepID=A0A3D9L959_MARFU|nr:amidohydrolase family protein [Marinoscillum furvescens]REE02007.1 L-fuconolactonase [Marinoscillum furvescens DSM 4134]